MFGALRAINKVDIKEFSTLKKIIHYGFFFLSYSGLIALLFSANATKYDDSHSVILFFIKKYAVVGVLILISIAFELFFGFINFLPEGIFKDYEYYNSKTIWTPEGFKVLASTILFIVLIFYVALTPIKEISMSGFYLVEICLILIYAMRRYFTNRWLIIETSDKKNEELSRQIDNLSKQINQLKDHINKIPR